MWVCQSDILDDNWKYGYVYIIVIYILDLHCPFFYIHIWLSIVYFGKSCVFTVFFRIFICFCVIWVLFLWLYIRYSYFMSDNFVYECNIFELRKDSKQGWSREIQFEGGSVKVIKMNFLMSFEMLLRSPHRPCSTVGFTYLPVGYTRWFPLTILRTWPMSCGRDWDWDLTYGTIEAVEWLI